MVCPLLVCITSAGCTKDEPAGADEADRPKKKKKPKERQALYGQVRIGAHMIPAFPIEEAQPKLWHYRVHFLGDQALEYERVSPSGVVHNTAQIVKAEKKADGDLHVAYHDDHGILVEDQHVHDGKVTSLQRSGATDLSGCEVVEEKYDDQGHAILERCFGPTGELIADSNGCHQEARTFDARHGLVSSRCLGPDDKPKDDRYDTYERTFTYGDRGETRTITFRTASGQHPAGCATLAYDYDERLNEVRERCLDGEGKPTVYLGSQAVLTEKAYDDNGCEVKLTFRDADGKPSTRDGVAEWRYEQTPTCEATLEESLNLEGKLMAPRQGVPARLRFTRNDEGLMIERHCFGANGKPTPCRSTRGTATVVHYDYDDKGRMTAWSGFDDAGKPCRHDADYPHKFKLTLDAKGRSVKQEFLDTAGAPATALGGVHATITAYDGSGLLSSISTQGIDGKLVLPTTLCATITFERNAEHQLTGMRCLDTEGKLNRSRLIYEGLNWQSASSLEVVRDGAKITNILRNTQGAAIKTIDCQTERAVCMQ